MPAHDLPPHEMPPNMLNGYMTRYDYDYNMGDPPLRPLVAEGTESGHSRNRPLFGRPPLDDWRSVSHTTFVDENYLNIARPSELPAIAAAAGRSRVLATAHIRGEPSRAGVLWDERPTESTYRGHYTAKFTTAPNGGNYAGNLTAQYKPWLLTMDSLDDDGVGKRRKPKGWRPEDDLVGRPQTIGAGVARPQDRISVFTNLSKDGQPWQTEASTYGDRTLDKPSLLPKSFGQSTVNSDRTTDNKRQLLEQLAGRRPTTGPVYGSQFDTNPIPMRPDEREQCRVAKRGPLEGPVINMTMYQSDFVTQTNKGELRDAPRDKSVGPQFVKGKTAPFAPKGVHPSVAAALERRGMGDIGDRHLHKYRPREGYSSPDDTMHCATTPATLATVGSPKSPVGAGRAVVAGRSRIVDA